MCVLGAGLALVMLASCSSEPKTRYWEITKVEPHIRPVSLQPPELGAQGSYGVEFQQGQWVGHQGAYPLTEGSVPPPITGGTVAPVGGAMVQGHPVQCYRPQRTGSPYDIVVNPYGGRDRPDSGAAVRPYGALGSSPPKMQTTPNATMAQPAFGTMQGSLAAPDQGPGAVGTTLIDPATGNERDFRNVVLNPQTMDPRNVNRRALDRL